MKSTERKGACAKIELEKEMQIEKEKLKCYLKMKELE